MRKRSGETRDTIITNAKALFLANGYISTTVDQIATNSHTTKRTLYGYFNNKEDILKEVLETSIGVPWVFAFSVDDITTEEDLYYILYNIANGVNEVYSSTDYVQLIRMVITEVNNHPEMYEMLSNGITKRSLALVARVLSIANEKEIVSIADTEFRAQSFIGGLLAEFYSDGLLAPHQKTLRRYNHNELMTYVGSCMPTLLHKVREHAV